VVEGWGGLHSIRGHSHAFRGSQCTSGNWGGSWGTSGGHSTCSWASGAGFVLCDMDVCCIVCGVAVVLDA